MSRTVKSLIALYLILLTGFVGVSYKDASQALSQSRTAGAVNNFQPVQAQKFSLSGAGVTSSATSITVTNFLLPDAKTQITMSMFGTIGYATLEPGTTKEENISFTGVSQNGNGTATLTGVTRGLAFTYPFAASTTLAYAHAGGTYLALSNSSAFYSQFVLKNSDATIAATYTYSSTTPPQYDANYTASGNQFVSFNQLNATAIAGAGTSTESALGLVRLASATQVGSSTASSTSGAPLVIPNQYATTTPGTPCTTGGLSCLVAGISGKIKQTWLDLTQAFTFSGGLTSTATTTLTGSDVHANAIVLNGIAYAFPSVLGASSTALATDATGKLTWEPVASTTITQVSTTFAEPTAAGGTGSATATCGAGATVVGGGFNGLNGTFGGTSFLANLVEQSSPSGSNGWTVMTVCAQTAGGTCPSGTVTVYALCLK